MIAGSEPSNVRIAGWSVRQPFRDKLMGWKQRTITRMLDAQMEEKRSRRRVTSLEITCCHIKMALPAHILTAFWIDRIISGMSCWIYMGLTVMLVCGLNAVELGMAVTLRKKYCECDFKDTLSELSKHVTSIWIKKDCLRSGMSLPQDLYVNRVTLTLMTYLGWSAFLSHV